MNLKMIELLGLNLYQKKIHGYRLNEVFFIGKTSFVVLYRFHCENSEMYGEKN